MRVRILGHVRDRAAIEGALTSAVDATIDWLTDESDGRTSLWEDGVPRSASMELRIRDVVRRCQDDAAVAFRSGVHINTISLGEGEPFDSIADRVFAVAHAADLQVMETTYVECEPGVVVLVDERVQTISPKALVDLRTVVTSDVERVALRVLPSTDFFELTGGRHSVEWLAHTFFYGQC